MEYWKLVIYQMHPLDFLMFPSENWMRHSKKSFIMVRMLEIGVPAAIPTYTVTLPTSAYSSVLQRSITTVHGSSISSCPVLSDISDLTSVHSSSITTAASQPIIDTIEVPGDDDDDDDDELTSYRHMKVSLNR